MAGWIMLPIGGLRIGLILISSTKHIINLRMCNPALWLHTPPFLYCSDFVLKLCVKLACMFRVKKINHKVWALALSCRSMCVLVF